MPRVTVVQVIYNNRRFIEPVFSAIFKQTYKDFNVVAVISGNDDKGKELLIEKFPQVEIIDPGYNIGFAAGHNLVFSAKGGSAFGGEKSEFFQLVNPDLILEPDYIAQMLKAFDDPKVGAATGKLYQWDTTRGILVQHKDAPCVLDSTGVTISKSGRARDRGQHEEDRGQYDRFTIVDAVSGAGCIYRRSALEKIKTPVLNTTPAAIAATPPILGGEAPDFAKASSGEPRLVRCSFSEGGSSPPGTGGVPSVAGGSGRKFEYFDEDFHSYWEDVDLSWRMVNAGWKNVFVPSAVGYHGRGAGSSKKGYTDVIGLIKHHKTLSPRVRQLNYQNHLFLYIKNAKRFYPQFFTREFFMFWYILFFEIGTFKVLPSMLKLLPKMWEKRKLIQSSSRMSM